MLPNLDRTSRHALFLDLDGTVAEIAPTPQSVVVDEKTRGLLQRLRRRFDGAVAIISGRDLDGVDALLSPVAMPGSGAHGAMRRDAAGTLHMTNDHDFTSLQAALHARFGNESGVIVESKRTGVALHYRLRPELRDACREAAAHVAGGDPRLRLIDGKMVVEIGAAGVDKGAAIEAFLREPPFTGRTPIFAGDDETDEAGFFAVNARNGVSIKVGAGRTVARFRTESVESLRAWLDRVARDTEESAA